MKKAIGDTLKQARKEQGLKQKNVASQTGLGISQVSHIEQGKSNYTIDSFIKICDLLKLKILNNG